ncbi:hypothetical protein HMPREF3156_01964 [Neisseria sp. HMSC06F02]|nr:hypothetical protein HMPREF3156_01964 [Neisseria sp. HMSC06F02]
MGNHGAAGLGDFAVCAGFGGIKGDGAGVGAAVVVFEPDFGAFGVGKVLFVEDFEFGFAFGKLGKQGVFAGGGHSCVQHFNHHVDAFGALGDGFFCFVHVAGKPLDCHVLFFLSDLRWGRLKSGSAVFSDDLRFVRFLCKGRLKAFAVFQTTFWFGALKV